MEERVKKTERRIKTVEEAILVLSEKIYIHDDWWEEHRVFQRETEANQKDTEAKIAALVDAQIQSEQEMREFRHSTKKMFGQLIKLLEKMDKRIEAVEKKNGNGKKK